jgi:hypothetical protein
MPGVRWRGTMAVPTGDVVQADRLLDEATAVLRQAGRWFLTWALYIGGLARMLQGV